MSPVNVNRWISFVAAITVFCLFAIFASLAGAASDVSKKRSFGLRSTGEGHIQMRSFMVPVQKSKKSKRVSVIPVTVILTIKNKMMTGKVCNRGPRITDSLMTVWHKTPIEADYLYDRQRMSGKTNIRYRRTTRQKAEDKRLIRIINHAIGSNEVSRILVLKGIMRMGKGAVTRLPFSSVNGCDELEISK